MTNIVDKMQRHAYNADEQRQTGAWTVLLRQQAVQNNGVQSST